MESLVGSLAETSVEFVTGSLATSTESSEDDFQNFAKDPAEFITEHFAMT